MARAYLTIDVEVGKERTVRDALKKIHSVVRVDLVTGKHDLIVTVEGRSYESLFETVIKKIRGIKGITRTNTHIAVG